MITEQKEKARTQIAFVCTDDLVPQDHLLRIIDKAIDWSFIYDLVRDKYSHRKETIERIFGTAKENHGFRYTQMYGKARMRMKVALTFACMDLKKLAKIQQEWALEMA